MEKEISLGFILGTVVCVVKKLFKYALMGAIADDNDDDSL